jgi:hypothetical protein
MSLTANLEFRASSDTLEIRFDIANVRPRKTSATPPIATEYLRTFPKLASTDPDLDGTALFVISAEGIARTEDADKRVEEDEKEEEVVD